MYSKNGARSLEFNTIAYMCNINLHPKEKRLSSLYHLASRFEFDEMSVTREGKDLSRGDAKDDVER